MVEPMGRKKHVRVFSRVLAQFNVNKERQRFSLTLLVTVGCGKLCVHGEVEMYVEEGNSCGFFLCVVFCVFFVSCEYVGRAVRSAIRSLKSPASEEVCL